MWHGGVLKIALRKLCEIPFLVATGIVWVEPKFPLPHSQFFVSIPIESFVAF